MKCVALFNFVMYHTCHNVALFYSKSKKREKVTINYFDATEGNSCNQIELSLLILFAFHLSFQGLLSMTLRILGMCQINNNPKSKRLSN